MFLPVMLRAGWSTCGAVGAVVEGRVRVVDDGADAVGVRRRRPRTSRSVFAPCRGRPRSTPWVWPETRLSAPGVDGPNVVPKELSLIAKCWA